MAYTLKYSYNSTTQSYKVTGYENITTSDNVVIPSTYNDGTNGEHPVTSIGDWAFQNCSSLTSVTIPDTVTSMGMYTFSGCTSLTSVTIENGVTSIGRAAFNNCTSLMSVTIPDSVKTIGEQAFYNCNKLTSVTIGNGVTSIRDLAFYNCSGLTSVTIPDSVTSIGERAFYGCSSLTSIAVSGGNTEYCSENGILFNKDKTQLVCYPVGKTETSYTIPDSVTEIGERAFSGCTSLTSVTIGSGVTSIGIGAFEECSKLTSVTIGSGVTEIGVNAFYGCSSLTSVEIGDSVTSIGGNAFYGCSSLTRVTIPDSVTTFGSGAFEECTNLESVTIGSGVTEIGVSAFKNCSGLTSVTIPDSVKTIGQFAFENCTKLKSVTIPDSVTTFGANAFTDLESIVMLSTTPPSLTVISYPPNFIPYYPIPSTIQNIYVQESALDTYKQAENWSTFTDKIVSDNLYLSFVRYTSEVKKFVQDTVYQSSNTGSSAEQTIKKVVLPEGTATQGTFTEEELQLLTSSGVQCYIVYNGENYFLNDEQVESNLLVYSHVGHLSTGEYYIKTITVDISGKTWSQNEVAVGGSTGAGRTTLYNHYCLFRFTSADTKTPSPLGLRIINDDETPITSLSSVAYDLSNGMVSIICSCCNAYYNGEKLSGYFAVLSMRVEGDSVVMRLSLPAGVIEYTSYEDTPFMRDMVDVII